MRHLGLVLLTLAACKSNSSSKPVSNDKPDPTAKVEVPKPTPAPEPPAPPAPQPVEDSGVLGIKLQRVTADGAAYRVMVGRVSVEFKSRPEVAAQDQPVGTSAQIVHGANIGRSGDDGFDAVVYMPTMDLKGAFNVEAGLEGAREGMLKTFASKPEVSDEDSTLGSFKATHTIAKGDLEGDLIRVDFWLTFDPESKAMYTLFSIRKDGDASGVQALHDSFTVGPAPAKAPPPVVP